MNDTSILLAINGLRSAWLDPIAAFLGEWALFVYPLGLIALVLVSGRPRARDASDGVLAWLLALFVSESIVKPWIRRPRPTAIPELLERLSVLGDRPSPRSFSMPSGTAAACAAGAAWIWIRFGPRAGIPVALFALSIGLARIYAGVHWPSDVLAGFVGGACVALAVDRYARWARG